MLTVAATAATTMMMMATTKITTTTTVYNISDTDSNKIIQSCPEFDHMTEN
jgi:hypothetical protein